MFRMRTEDKSQMLRGSAWEREAGKQEQIKQMLRANSGVSRVANKG